MQSDLGCSEADFMLNKRFTATLQKSPNKGGWTYVIWPNSLQFFGTRGLTDIRSGVRWSSFMAMGDGTHKLPIKSELPKLIKKAAGETVTVRLVERITN